MHNYRCDNTVIIAEMILFFEDVLTKSICKGKITSEAKIYENNSRWGKLGGS